MNVLINNYVVGMNTSG